MATPKNATARNTRPARPTKPTMPKLNTPNKKGYKRVPPGGTDMRDLPSSGSASTAKKVKSFIKKYSQGMQ